MKKIKHKIANAYNQYHSLISKNIKIHLNKFTKFSSTISKKIIFFIIRLQFMKNNKVNISVFNRYLILIIVFLFSYLFYLSAPTLYNYGELQKELTNKLSKEFNLDTALSANINYKILPSPNFEISNVFLYSKIDNKFNDYAQIKKMKIYVYQENLHNQKKLKIKNIVISDANFDINENSYNHINNLIKNNTSNKKIIIKQSKIFFRKNNSEKKVLVLSSINKL